jgi:glutamine synthetase
MAIEPLVFIATTDIAGHTRGRSVPAHEADSALRRGVGWVPANLALSAFGPIAPGNAFGSTGDLRLMPVISSRVDIPADGDQPAMALYLAEQTNLDGTPWSCCPRTFARRALEQFTAQTGLEVVASFEHEFMIDGLDSSAPFSLTRLRSAEPFGSDLVDLLTQAHLEPETWLPEYGTDQFEITLAPTDALIAADRAILLKELIRDLARRRGHRTTFAPLPHPDGSGNGVHVHLSLRDATTGAPVLHDAAMPSGLSDIGRRFCAGILAHASAMVAITAPSPASFLRLTPNRWSSGGVFLAERNREALLRICPTATVGGGDTAKQYNLEYRPADATANPWLVIGTLVHAGLLGIQTPHDEPTIWPETTTEEDLATVPPLPATLTEALDLLEKDDVVREWFDPKLLQTHIDVKRFEIQQVDGLDAANVCQRVADVY